MPEIELNKIDELMLLTEEVRCLSLLHSMLKDYCDEELKDSRSIASATNMYLLKLNEKTTERLHGLVFDENFVQPISNKESNL